MGSEQLKAIPTEYNGVQMRSRTEARVAGRLDALGFKWLYEPEGIDLDGLWYMPDFWLPDCHTFVEAKGIWDQRSQEKVYRLWSGCLPMGITVVGSEVDRDHVFFGIVRPAPVDAVMGLYFKHAILDYRHIAFGFCTVCEKPWFRTDVGTLGCLNCGQTDKQIVDVQVEPHATTPPGWVCAEEEKWPQLRAENAGLWERFGWGLEPEQKPRPKDKRRQRNGCKWQRGEEYELSDRLEFGKHKGLTIESVIMDDPSYFEWADGPKGIEGFVLADECYDIVWPEW